LNDEGAAVAKDITIFDKILKKEIPSKNVYEDDHILAFHDINPQAPVHVIVIPKKKIKGFANFADSEPLDIGRFIKGVAEVARKLNLEPNGYRIVFNYGRDGLQTVDYIHAHILGGRIMEWPPG
jgi:histidine triad (HIT) family protein